VPPGVLERGLLLKLRFALDHHVNLRPVTAEGIDCVVVREGTEGPYAGAGGVLREGTPHEVATEESINTRYGVERVVRDAFDRAVQRRGHVTLVHKTNVLTYAGGLWSRTFAAVADEHPDVTTAYCHVDAACLHLVEDPGRFDVIVTDNLFGDILTDVAAAVAGGIGLAASGNIDTTRVNPSMFEPVHGSAPDIAGTGSADPVAAVRSVGMLLDHLGDARGAARVEAAVTTWLAERPDGVPTKAAGDEIVARLT
jgi:3-isopropylmalate dehydrogenase